MSAPPLPPACPVCAGPLLAGHPAGLVIQHRVECELLAGEDATKAADVERLDGGWWPLVRAGTPTERLLLAVEADRDLTVTVRALTPGVIRRDFAAHAPLAPTPEEDQS